MHKLLEGLEQVGVLRIKAGMLFSPSPLWNLGSIAGTRYIGGPGSSAASTVPLPVKKYEPLPYTVPQEKPISPQGTHKQVDKLEFPFSSKFYMSYI